MTLVASLQNFKNVSIILPTYNEAGNISGMICESAHSAKVAGITETEVIVVDDDSPDLTWKIASETVCPDADVRVIRRMEQHGLTASLNAGIAAARMDVVVWLDCDFSQPPDKIPQMLIMLTQGFDVVVNSRYISGGGEARSGKGGALQLFLSRCLNRLLRHILDPSFHDYTSGFVAARRNVFESMTLQGDYGEYFVDFAYRLLCDKRYRVCELPYIMQPRRSGVSKTGSNLFHFLIRGRKYLWTIIRLKFF
ncbi:MAG: glycosyltransferase [Steroidobacteraceae bacterium]|nr:glycosyltransferase [Deltaproteobacteria bacterium]